MGLWSAYFIAKLLLYARGDMEFDPWLNFGFAVFTALPPGNSRQRFAKNLIAFPVGALLLFHDAAPPPLSEITPLYLAARLYHSFSYTGILALAVVIAAYSLLRLKLRMSTFVFIAILGVALGPRAGLLDPATARAVADNEQHRPPAATAAVADPRNWQPQALDASLAAFYRQQSGQRVHFSRAAVDGVPYDILILQVASLSWDDLQTLKGDREPLFGRFDIVFSQFNSAASDTAPAEVRLMRGGCGQATERELNDPAPHECLLLDALQHAGFEPHWLVNDPANEGVLGNARQRGEIPASAESDHGGRVSQTAADDSPVFDDYSILSRWARRRAANPAARVALYYNSASLNDGNRRFGRGRGELPYAERVADFTADVNHFIDDLQHSGRHAIVIVIAEHGAALMGDSRQMPGLREIPTPSIARVPVGVILINVARSPKWVQARIDGPTSYLAVSELLARFIAENPFDDVNLNLERYTASLPQTPFVAENDGITVMQIDGRNLVRSPDGAWSSLDGG